MARRILATHPLCGSTTPYPVAPESPTMSIVDLLEHQVSGDVVVAAAVDVAVLPSSTVIAAASAASGDTAGPCG
ncbi:hypothetical protein GTS_44150 [Gandjariella thermophila]|uniref:Uncharacterized protein n=1 Tax=Gandjariella thermophila TaxID=1931992 RepID=A0A4D4JBS0_9PSEU|nr:hypothetical protein GTS_44150 [Gandjariella thermophila]